MRVDCPDAEPGSDNGTAAWSISETGSGLVIAPTVDCDSLRATASGMSAEIVPGRCGDYNWTGGRLTLRGDSLDLSDVEFTRLATGCRFVESGTLSR